MKKENYTKLYVDDLRDLPDSTWILARDYDEAIRLLTDFNFDEISLDHDIASFREDGREMTGYDIILWIVQRKMDGDHIPSKFNVHSANPVGVMNINGVIARYLMDD